jgi:starch synthase
LFDGFGKVFLEAMARGLCVIGTKTGGMPDVIRDGENGCLVGFDAPHEIVERINSLWADGARASMISSAAANIAHAYSWPRVARETVAFYQRLLELRTAALER